MARGSAQPEAPFHEPQPREEGSRTGERQASQALASWLSRRHCSGARASQGASMRVDGYIWG